MSGWKHAPLSEIERRNGWIPVRDRLGIQAFGVNAWVGKKPGDAVIGEHTEAWSRHEELYLVAEGHATFTVAGDEIDAPAGTLVFVRDPDTQRKAVAVEAETTVLAVGARPGEAFRVEQWELGWRENREARELAREQRYNEAADVLRRALEQQPDQALWRYNLACYASLGEHADEALEHLRIAIEQDPRFRDFAPGDTDFDPVRDDPRFVSLVAAPGA
jgi:tetratricopeptide (TPR) repeat protein